MESALSQGPWRRERAPGGPSGAGSEPPHPLVPTGAVPIWGLFPSPEYESRGHGKLALGGGALTPAELRPGGQLRAWVHFQVLPAGPCKRPGFSRCTWNLRLCLAQQVPRSGVAGVWWYCWQRALALTAVTRFTCLSLSFLICKVGRQKDLRFRLS